MAKQPQNLLLHSHEVIMLRDREARPFVCPSMPVPQI